MRRDIRFVGIQVLDEKPSRVGRRGCVLYAAPPADQRPSGAADLAVTIAETTGHAPEMVGHDAETAGHDDPKRRVGHDRRNHRSRCRNSRSRWSEIRIGDVYIPLAVSGLLETFKKRFADAWGVRMEHVFRNALYAVLDTGGGTLSDVLRLISEKDFRSELAGRIRNPVVKQFWQHEFSNYSDRYRADSVAPIQNKLSAFLTDWRVHRLVTKAKQEISFRRVMDDGGVLIVNLARGKLGEDSSALLGALFVTNVALAAYSRANLPEDARRPHYLYADEFQSFTTNAVADMISELRKYGLRLVVAHQHFEQLEDAVKYAILGNAGTLISFRVGAEDANVISAEFSGLVPAEDLVRLPNFTVYLRLLISGEPSGPFKATTIPLSTGELPDGHNKGPAGTHVLLRN